MARDTDDEQDQKYLSEKALKQKQEGLEETRHPRNEDHANEGFVPTPKPDQAPSGAFDAEGQRPVLERSRKVR